MKIAIFYSYTNVYFQEQTCKF